MIIYSTINNNNLNNIYIVIIGDAGGVEKIKQRMSAYILSYN